MISSLFVFIYASLFLYIFNTLSNYLYILNLEVNCLTLRLISQKKIQ